MPFKFNPFSGNFDQTGSGGGSSYIDGEVQNFSALPQTVGSPAVDSAYLVREAEGTWLLNRKPAGIYIRTANTGTRASDWTYAGEFPDVFSDDKFVLYDETDSSKNLVFQLSGISTGTTRTLTVPNASGTIQLTGHAASHAAGGSDPLFDQDLNTTDSVEFAGIIAPSVLYPDANGTGFSIENGELYENGNVAAVWAGLEFAIEKPLGFSGPNAATDISTTRTNLGLGTAATADIGTTAGEVAAGDHGHGNLTNDGKLGSTAGLPVVTTTAGAVTTLALGTANQILRVNSGASGVEFADPAAAGVTGAAASASDVLGVSGSDITGVDAGSADRLVFWDDSASKLTYAATTGGTFDGTTLRWPVELVIACSDETTNLTTGTAKVTFRAPYAFTLTGVRASVNTAPTGSTLIVDINEGGTSVLSTKLSIDASEKTSTTAASAAVISDSAIADDAEITIDIDQIGSTIAGKGLKVVLIGTRA